MSGHCSTCDVEHLGSFDTPEAAHHAYVSAAKEIFGEFAHD